MSDRLPPGADSLHTPALLVFMGAVRRNIQSVIDAVGSTDAWRPHVKTTKMAPVFAAMLDAGIRHFKCATTRELEHLLGTIRSHGTDGCDILLSHHLHGPGLERAADLAREHEAVRCATLVEDPSGPGRVDPSLSLFVDVHTGMERTGIPLGDIERIEATIDACGDRFRGLHVYDGQFHGLDPDTRRRAAHATYGELLGVLGTLGIKGELVTSGTPTFRDAIAYTGFMECEGLVHRVSPGTVVFNDLRSVEEQPDLELEHAACILSRVVSSPATGILTCDAGSKSIAAEAGNPCAMVEGVPGIEAGSPSEEHLPLAPGSCPAPGVGSLLLLVPRHVCPSVNLHERAVLVEDDGTWSIVPVDARAHDQLPVS